MEKMCDYDLFGRGSSLDFTTLLGFFPDTDTDSGNSSPSTLSPVSSSSSSPGVPDSSFGPWKSLGQDIGLILQRKFTSTTLDDVRNGQRHDFETNGIDMELDEFDRYQVQLRSSAPSTGTARRTAVQPQHQQVRDHGMKTRNGEQTWRNTVCVFCKNNGETLSVYGTHLLRDSSGRVTCPVLRRYTCPICSASGDAAHTVKYCPLNTKCLS